jgi:hypothetical protein
MKNNVFYFYSKEPTEQSNPEEVNNGKPLKMLGLFKKKSETEKLEQKYRKLLKDAFELSKVNRTESDKKQAEAQEILDQIEAMRKDYKHA